MSATGQASAPARPAPRDVTASTSWRLPGWWPLAALTLLAAALRLSTLDLQSFWYDEAFTPVHVLHPSLGATLRAIVHTENTPPLWYVLAWADSRVLGTGEIALRLPSALAGIAVVPVAWALGAELARARGGGAPVGDTPGPAGAHERRAALACAALVAVNPLFVWYSQEARAYGLFVLAGAVAMLCFLRAERDPTRGRVAAFALSGALALLTHYFALFLLIPMALWLLWQTRTRRAALPAVLALAVVGAALLPLISAQGGHGTQWIGRWPLTQRLQAIPQYYLTGYTGSALGHGVELLVALPILAALALGLWRMTAPASGVGAGGAEAPAIERRGLWLALAIAACGVLIPVALVGFGADYLAPRNLVAAMIPVTAVVALVAVWPASSGASLAGTCALAAIVLAFAAISVDVDLSPRLQRGNWRELAHELGPSTPERAITTVELGSAPFEYYLGALRNLHRDTAVRVREIDETGYAPLRSSAGEPPAPGFALRTRLDVDGLIDYRFVSPVPRLVSEAALRRHAISLEGPHEVLVGPAAQVTPTRHRGSLG